MTLFQRLKAASSGAGWDGSPVSPTDQAKTVAAIVKRLPRPKPCQGQEAPSATVYGRQK